jgi:hypothetical protein
VYATRPVFTRFTEGSEIGEVWWCMEKQHVGRQREGHGEKKTAMDNNICDIEDRCNVNVVSVWGK